MKYRIASIGDVEQINELCVKNGIDVPTLQTCMVAEDDGKIVAYINAMIVPLIDTASDNPMVTRPLHDKFSGYLLGLGYGTEFMFTKKPNVEAVAEKYGFKKIRDAVNVFIKEL